MASGRMHQDSATSLPRVLRERSLLPWELGIPSEASAWRIPLHESLSIESSSVERSWESKGYYLGNPSAMLKFSSDDNPDGNGRVGTEPSGLQAHAESAQSSTFPTVAFADIKCDVKENSGSGNYEDKNLPPIGVFWDIENCSVPKGRSALVAVQRIRNKFFLGHVEAEFLCVCDIRKESAPVIQELNDAQVSVIHVAGNSKNAADDKLRQAMRRFADISCSNPINSKWLYPATVILISGDINFIADVSDLRYRKRLYIILLHNKQTPDALLMCAHEQYEFHTLLSDLPYRTGLRDFVAESSTNLPVPLKGGLSRVDVFLSELPFSNNVRTQNFIRNRLRKLSENCGGKVMSVQGQWAVIRFPNYEAALRASKRMNGEDVLGNKIRVVRRQQIDFDKFQQTASTSFQQEEYFQESWMNNMQCHNGKSNYGIFSNSSYWKPTWKKQTASDTTRSAMASRHNQLMGDRNYELMNHPTTQSSSETSRDDSPNIMVRNGGPGQSDNSNQCHSATRRNDSFQTNNNMAGSQLPFHPYPTTSYQGMMECGTANASTSLGRSDYHQQSSYVDNAGSVRLYSTVGSAQENRGMVANAFGQGGFTQMEMNSTTSPVMSTHAGHNDGVGQRRPLAPTCKSSDEEHQLYVDTSTSNNCGNKENYAKHRITAEDPFDLTVTNIDPAIGDWKAIRGMLSSSFSDCVSIKGIWVFTASDGSVTATVRLSNKEDAHLAISQLHRKKIGNKRIFISFDQGNAVDYNTLKKEVASLLQDVPNRTLPLFKFREMFEKRYKRSVSSSDLYRMKDVVTISENSTMGSCGISTPSSGRSISLASTWQAKEGKGLNLYCIKHPPKTRGSAEKSRMGWAEKEAEVMLPNVTIEIKVLRTRIHSMLHSHDSGIPLISFLDCYEAEFGPLEVGTEGRGVPLEHLISCVQGVEIIFGENGMKRVQWHEKKDGESNGSHQPLGTALSQFGRELIDLLKTFPKCTLLFSKLIPSYHAHFGRQCRVADYGHVSLITLLQTLPHIIQIMGAAQNRVLTLSHRAQMKRFATDLLRVLKSQGGPKKQIRMEDFPDAFLNVFPNRSFQAEDYGLCSFVDLVAELVENSTLVALVKDEEGHFWLAVPKREQTPHEIYRTRLFAAEVVELLRHSTRCELEFSRFVPYYHHHFQKQCRVSDYGFSKLIELFDAINDTVTILGSSGSDGAPDDKIIRLTPKEQIKVVGEQICNIVEKRKQEGLRTNLDDLEESFLEDQGFFLRPDLCGADDLNDLITNKLERFVKLIGDDEITTVDRIQMEDLSQKAEIILQNADQYAMDMEEFLCAINEQCGGAFVDEGNIEKDLYRVAVIESKEDEQKSVRLSPLRVFAHEITLLLDSTNGSLPLSSLENAYFDKFGCPLRAAQMGYPTVLAMLQDISDVVSVIGKQQSKRIVILNSAKGSFESVSDDSSSSYNGRQTPRQNWKSKYNRNQRSAGSSRQGRTNEGNLSQRRRSAPPPSLYSPLASPAFTPSRPSEMYSYERPPLSPPMYDMWIQDSVAPGSPPISPPVVWTCHPIFYPQSPGASAGPGNILVTSPYVTPTPWSSPPINSNCFEGLPQSQMLGNEFLFGQARLEATFDKLAVGPGGNEV